MAPDIGFTTLSAEQIDIVAAGRRQIVPNGGYRKGTKPCIEHLKYEKN